MTPHRRSQLFLPFTILAYVRYRRANTLTAFLRVLRDTKPRAFPLRNVPGLAFKGKDEGMQHVLDELEQVNHEAKTHYRATWTVINAATWGVPKQRERLFMVGSRDGRPFQFPALTHGDPEKMNPQDGREPYRTAWDALGDLPQRLDDEDLAVRGRWADLLPTIPEGQNYLWHTNRGGGGAPLRLAHLLLELPAEASEKPSFPDDSGAAWASHWSFPLDESEARGCRAVQTPNLSGFASIARAMRSNGW